MSNRILGNSIAGLNTYHLLLYTSSHAHCHPHIFPRRYPHSTRAMCAPTSPSHSRRMTRWNRQEATLYHHRLIDGITHALHHTPQSIDTPHRYSSEILGLFFWRFTHNIWHNTSFPKSVVMVRDRHRHRKEISGITRECCRKRRNLVTYWHRSCTRSSI